MNQPIVAAISGLVFGSILCVSTYTYLHHRPHHSCGQRSAASFVPMKVQPTVAPPPVAVLAEVVKETPPTDCTESEQTLSRAQTAFVNGDFAEATRIAKMCAPVSPTRAYRILGAAGCNAQDLDAVRLSYRRLDSAGRQYLIYACKRQNIEIVVKDHAIVVVRQQLHK